MNPLHLPGFYRPANVILLMLILLLATIRPLAADVLSESQQTNRGRYQELVELLDDFLEFRDPQGQQPRQIIRDVAGQSIDPVADYGNESIAWQIEQMRQFQARIERLDVSSWTQAQQVDYLAVQSRLDQHQFILQRTRPWARDPGFYVDRMLRVTFTQLPLEGEALDSFLKQIRTVPVLVSEAYKHLDDVAADYADLAIHNLNTSDGVGHGYPYRAQPPAGVLGWYDDLLDRARAQPGLLEDIRAARAAVQGFEGWLKQQRPTWTAAAGVGEAAFDWYLKHVKLMPWTSAEIVVLGQRELDRLWADYALERHRNRALPELEPAVSAEDYQRRIDATDQAHPCVS